jgi:hypothetical protein
MAGLVPAILRPFRQGGMNAEEMAITAGNNRCLI